MLGDIAAGEMISYALSEREAGSDAASMRTRAVLDGDTWVLNGTKCWITNAGRLDVLHGHGGDRPGEEGQRHLGIRRAQGRPGILGRREGAQARHQGQPDLRDLLRGLPHPRRPDHRRAGTGFKTALRTLDHTRLAIGAQALGIAQGAFDAACDYISSGASSASRVADFQGIQFMVADMGMRIEAARQLVYAAAARAERDEPNLTFTSAAAKVFASDTAMAVTTDAVQLFGGYGYTKDFPVERMMRDAKITQIYEGTNQINRMVMARNLLK